MKLDFEDVRRHLAHRFPLLMVDRALEVEPGRRIVVEKHVTGNEIHFLGHFPGRAIMPGVLILESAAQAAALLLACSRQEALPPGTVLVLGTVRAWHFMKPVVPGDTLRVEVQVLKMVDAGAIVEGRVTVDGQEVAGGTLVFGQVRYGDGGQG